MANILDKMAAERAREHAEFRRREMESLQSRFQLVQVSARRYRVAAGAHTSNYPDGLTVVWFEFVSEALDYDAAIAALREHRASENVTA